MMKDYLIAPRGIRYISEWQDFQVPKKSLILDKKIPGCGFTEWILGNDEDTILCSPRLMLIDNKADQHKGELMVVNGSGVDLGIDTDIETKRLTKYNTLPIGWIDRSSEEKSLTEIIGDNFDRYSILRKKYGKPLKIIVTYDSFRILKDVLEFKGVLEKFHVYVDEFQSIFTDSRFKADTETGFLDSLQNLAPCYVSATPMMEKYLNLLPEFKDLPYYEIDWKTNDVTRICKPNLKIFSSQSIISDAKKIINEYLSGKYEIAYSESGNIIKSKEAVFFCNSVNNIISIIVHAKLNPDQVNILCANTEFNKEKIKLRLGKGWKIGTVPLRNEPRKMFTFCTRTVYLGADFYSDNARTFIFSDASIETLSVDISLDLPQIMGRQRLNSNPWKNQAEFYCKFNACGKRNLTQGLIDKKLKATQASIDAVNSLSGEERKQAVNAFKTCIQVQYYKERYLSVSYEGGEHFVVNNLVLIAEQRAFDIQDIDYANRFSVFNTIDSVLGTSTKEVGVEIAKFWKKFKEMKTKADKLRLICETDLSPEAREHIEKSVSVELKNALTLGKEKLKALGYKNNLDNLAQSKILLLSLDDIIYQEFKVGDRLSNKEIKSRIKNIYLNNQIKLTPKAIDIEKWFQTKPCTINLGGKRINGLELIKKLK